MSDDFISYSLPCNSSLYVRFVSIQMIWFGFFQSIFLVFRFNNTQSKLTIVCNNNLPDQKFYYFKTVLEVWHSAFHCFKHLRTLITYENARTTTRAIETDFISTSFCETQEQINFSLAQLDYVEWQYWTFKFCWCL